MGIKDHFKNMVNRGNESPSPLKSSELSSVEAEVDEITKNLERERLTREGIGRFLKHPVDVLTEKPVNIFIVSIPLALILLIGGFITMVASYGTQVLFTSTVIDDFVVFAVLIAIVPVAVLDFKEQWRIKSLENALPNFFRDLAGMNDSRSTSCCRCRVFDAHPAHQTPR
jgi:flagellar protein FlaJ